MITFFKKLHYAQNNAVDILKDAGFSDDEIVSYSNLYPTHVNIPTLPNLIYIIFDLDLYNDIRLNCLLDIIEKVELDPEIKI